MKMKVMAFSARPDERAFFEHWSQTLDIDLTYQPDGLSMKNVAQTKGYDGVSCVGTCNLSAPVLEALAKNGVRYVSLRTIGFDNVDLEEAARLGIRVSHAGYSPYSVANYTVMLILMCIRKAGYIMFRSHTADYSLGAAGAARGMEMQNLTIGVIGTGRIGKAVIENLSGFGCNIIAHDPYPSPDLKNVEYVSLDQLYARADVITLHTFLDESTHHMIDAQAIEKMKPGVVIINCARGALIDTRALIDGIESGRIGAVGVDCFEGENDVIRVDHSYNSRVTNHDYIILKSFQNTIVTPHMAFFTDQAVFDMVQCSLESLRQFYDGEKVPLEVCA